MLQGDAECCSVLQCVAVCCRCACSMHLGVWATAAGIRYSRVLQCCRVMQCVAAFWSVLQYIAVCCSVFTLEHECARKDIRVMLELRYKLRHSSIFFCAAREGSVSFFHASNFGTQLGTRWCMCVYVCVCVCVCVYVCVCWYTHCVKPPIFSGVMQRGNDFFF